MGMSSDSYRKQLQGLLPRGLAWPRDMMAGLTSILQAIADELARVDRRGDDLMREANPRTTVEMLPDWERAFGLPDPCITTSDEMTQAERRNILMARITGIGGQSREYFIGVAADLGYVISIDEFRPFRAGISVAGDPLTNGDWVFTWRVNAPPVTIIPFLAGAGAAGEPLRTWGNEQLECTLSRLKPAHTILQFAYGG